MNKFFTLIAILCFGVVANAQLIPNGNFESWTTTNCDYPTYYPNSSNMEAIMRNKPFNMTKSTDAFHGTYAVQLVSDTVNDMFGYFYNSDSQTDPDKWVGGVAVSGIPTGIRGHYKYNVASGDSATIIIVFRKGGSLMGMQFFNMGGNHSNYTTFDFTFTPALTEAPDSMVVAFASSDVINERMKNGSTLLIDSVSITGLATQPALLNGDFEQWSTLSIKTPDVWTVSAVQDGVEQTTDSYEGTYGIQLNSILQENRNRTSSIMNGEWVEVTPNNFEIKGGTPYSEQVDTLEFYYKYEVGSLAIDTAKIDVFFLKNGAQIFILHSDLLAVSDYTLKSLPFDIGQSPDSVIISIQSGDWDSDSSIYAGAKLIIDNLMFKSETTTSIFNKQKESDLFVYPNPSSGLVYVSLPEGTEIVSVKDIQGRVVASKTIGSASITKYCTFDVANLSNGMYLVTVSSKNNTYSTKFSVQH